jgi:hypothetical protein
MAWLRRVTVSIGLAVSVAASLTIASVAAATGFGAGAGTFTFTDTSAFANFFNPADFSSVDVNVDHSTFLFKTRPNGQLQTGVMTILNVTQFIPNADPTLPPTINSTCLVIPDGDFSVSGNLQSATLNVVNESTQCPGFLVPLTGAAPAKGTGGGGGGIPLPLSINASWTGNGALGVSDSNGTFRCLTFVSITHDHNLSALSLSVAATISNIGSFNGGPQSGVFGSVAMNTHVENVAGQGILPPQCGGKGGG